MVTKNPETGLPVLPEGIWWRIVHNKLRETVLIQIVGPKEITTTVKKFLRKNIKVTSVNPESILRYTEVYTHYGTEKELKSRIRKEAWRIAIDFWNQENNIAVAASLAGDYPPNKFPEDDKQTSIKLKKGKNV